MGASFLRQARQRCQLLQIFAQRLRGSSPENHAFAAQNFVGQDAALAAEHDSRFNARVFADADLAAEHHAILNSNATGEAGLRGNDDIFADLAIVADVDQVIDFRAAANARFVQRAAIDGRIGSDLDIIFNAAGGPPAEISRSGRSCGRGRIRIRRCRALRLRAR